MTGTDLAGRAVMVTGGAGGLGSAMVAALLGNGARVCALDASQENLGRLSAKLADAGLGAGSFLPLCADVSDINACEQAVNDAESSFGQLDMLINNAGISLGIVRPDYLSTPIKFWELGHDHWRRIMAINLRAGFVLSRAAMPGMVARGFGKIVNVTTSLQNMMRVGATPYATAKAGLEASSAIWAKDAEGTGVTVNVLEPGGPADTGLIPNDPSVKRELLTKAEVMGPPICWLASPDSDAVTGHRFVANEWDTSLSAGEAAKKNMAPIGWPGIGHGFNNATGIQR